MAECAVVCACCGVCTLSVFTKFVNCALIYGYVSLPAVSVEQMLMTAYMFVILWVCI